jgi:hypothetical protein
MKSEKREKAKNNFERKEKDIIYLIVLKKENKRERDNI